MQGEQGWVSRYTLLTPLTPFSGGCKACVYRHYDTLTPLNIKFSRARARETGCRKIEVNTVPRSKKMDQRTVQVIRYKSMMLEVKKGANMEEASLRLILKSSYRKNIREMITRLISVLHK